jgi:predicted N-acetyltransferase YhbS
MSFEEDDSVVLHDEHSEYDGETGTITQVMESMFGDANYTISFEDGQESGVPEDSLELVDDDEAEADEE